MSEGFFIAQKQSDGSVGTPIGNDEGAIMLFESLSLARTTMENLAGEIPKLAIFRVNLVLVGEVVL